MYLRRKQSILIQTCPKNLVPQSSFYLGGGGKINIAFLNLIPWESEVTRAKASWFYFRKVDISMNPRRKQSILVKICIKNLVPQIFIFLGGEKFNSALIICNPKSLRGGSKQVQVTFSFYKVPLGVGPLENF